MAGLAGLIAILLVFAVYWGVVALIGFAIAVPPTTQGILSGLAAYSAFVAFAPDRERFTDKIEQVFFGLAGPVLVTFAVSLH